MSGQVYSLAGDCVSQSFSHSVIQSVGQSVGRSVGRSVGVSRSVGQSVSQLSNFMKIRPVEVAMTRTDRQTDDWTNVAKSIGAFRCYAKAPKKNNRKK